MVALSGPLLKLRLARRYKKGPIVLLANPITNMSSPDSDHSPPPTTPPEEPQSPLPTITVSPPLASEASSDEVSEVLTFNDAEAIAEMRTVIQSFLSDLVAKDPDALAEMKLKPLDRATCANPPTADGKSKCGEAKLVCGSCKLVAYCSKVGLLLSSRERSRLIL